MLFSNPDCRTIVYTYNFTPLRSVALKWLMPKSGPTSDVVNGIIEAFADTGWA